MAEEQDGEVTFSFETKFKKDHLNVAQHPQNNF